MLGAHLALCSDCRKFADDVAWQAESLRAAPLERMSSPVTIPSKRAWRWPAVGVSTGAVAASIFALAIGLRGTGPQQPSSPLSTPRPAERADRLGSLQSADVRLVRLALGGAALRGDPHGTR